MNGKTNRIFYRCGVILFFLGIGAMLLWKVGSLDFLMKYPGCMFERVTGLYCPGCGGTRACFALLRLQLWNSFCYHPAVIYFLAVYLIFMGRMFLLKHFGIGTEHEGRLIIFIYIGIGVILTQWIIKLICLLVFHVTWL